MNTSIKTKLLVMCVLLVLLLTVGISATYYTLTRQEKQRESQARIQIAFDIIFDDFNSRVDTYADGIERFVRDNFALGMTAQFYNQDPGQMQSLDFIAAYFFELADEVKNFGQATASDRVLLYGADARLLLAYTRTEGQEDIGVYRMTPAGVGSYLSIQNQIARSRLLIDTDAMPETPLPDGIAASYPARMPDELGIEFFIEGRRLGLRIAAPLYRNAKSVGLLVGEVFHTQAVTAQYAHLSKTAVNFFAHDQFSVGTLPAQTAIATASLEQSIPCRDLMAGKRVVTIVSRSFDAQRYYQGQCSINAFPRQTPGAIVGGITVSLSQAIEQREIRKILTAVFGISMAGILLAVSLVSGVLVPTFTGPIIKLTEASLSMAKGDLRHAIDTSGHDELGTLSRSFAHMRDEIRREQKALAAERNLLRTLIDALPDLIYVKDTASRFVVANQAITAAMGAQSPDELVGKTDADFYPEHLIRHYREDEQSVLRSGQPLQNREEPVLHKQTGAQVWLLTTKVPLRDPQGAITGLVGIGRDITIRKQAEDALRRLNQELEQRVQARTADLEMAYKEISLLNNQLQQENLRMGAELDVVRQLQNMVLPRPEELQQIEELEIVGYMRPADEVGGDYYDVLYHDGAVHIGIGDVTGHGLESGVVMLMTQTAIRTLLEHGETDPVKFVNTLNRTIYKNTQRMHTDKTLTFTLLNYQQGRCQIAGQHEDVLVVRKHGVVERFDTTELGFPVGLVAEISQWVTPLTIALAPGDGIVLYTDGIPEAENPANEPYGVERLCDVISRHWAHSAEAVKQAVIDDVVGYIGTQEVYDDLTLIVMKK